MKGCILIYCDKIEYDNGGDEIHWYGGYFMSHNRNEYIKTFTSAGFTLTENIHEAKVFTKDDECNKCMECMVEHGAQTICVWEYDNSSKLMQLKRLMEMWERDSNKYRGYDFYLHSPIDFGEEFNSAIDHPTSQHVAYPNKHWSSNNHLQPSLMYSSVAEWLEKHNN